MAQIEWKKDTERVKHKCNEKKKAQVEWAERCINGMRGKKGTNALRDKTDTNGLKGKKAQVEIEVKRHKWNER